MALLLASTFFLPSAQACEDQFLANFSYQPKDESFWLSPDIGPTPFTLPLSWEASYGNFKIAMRVTRVDEKQLEVSFSRKDPTTSSSLVVRIKPDDDRHTPISGVLKDSANGDRWALKLTPACSSI